MTCYFLPSPSLSFGEGAGPAGGVPRDQRQPRPAGRVVVCGALGIHYLLSPRAPAVGRRGFPSGFCCKVQCNVRFALTTTEVLRCRQ